MPEREGVGDLRSLPRRNSPLGVRGDGEAHHKRNRRSDLEARNSFQAGGKQPIGIFFFSLDSLGGLPATHNKSRFSKGMERVSSCI